MSKYYCFMFDYDRNPCSKSNFISALKRIGEKDPKSIIKTKLNGEKVKIIDDMTDNQYIGRGILNIRKELNKHLGKSGKYSNRMIRLCAQVRLKKEENGSIWLKSKLPYREYKSIVNTVYKILNECDKEFCEELLNIEQGDEYLQKSINNNIEFKTIAPIQTNMIIRTTKAKTLELNDYVKKFRKYIMEDE